MPAIGNIVINDGATTPVAHTFAPVNIEGITARYADRSGGIPVGYYTLDISLRQPVSSSQEPMYLATLRVKLPVLEQTSPSTATGIQPAPTVAFTMISETKYWMSERSSLQNRKDINALHKNALANAAWTAVIENLETIY